MDTAAAGLSLAVLLSHQPIDPPPIHLFLQFVVSASKPASSYVLPTDQLAIATMSLLLLIAAESVAVHSLATWRDATHAAAVRRAARERCLARKAAAAAAAAADAASSSASLDASLPIKAPPSPASTAASSTRDASRAAAAAAAAEAAVTAVDCGPRSPAPGQPGGRGGGPGGGGCRRGLRRLASLSDDAEYDAWVAYQVDRAAAAALLLSYALAVVLIFALQNGYVQIFP